MKIKTPGTVQGFMEAPGGSRSLFCRFSWKRSRRAAFALGLLVLGGAAPAAIAQSGDLFDFIAPGGRTLLGKLIGQGKVNPDDVLSASRTLPEWRSFLDGPAAALDDIQKDTLAAYLASTMPPAEKNGKTIDTNGIALPRDGRDLIMEYCQSCHIITVVITQERSRDAWLGTMNKPSHVEIDTTRAEREAIADYLVLNGGISIDDVPEELRAGGATY